MAMKIVDILFYERMKLLDLLIGRELRVRANETLQGALKLEEIKNRCAYLFHGLSLVDVTLESYDIAIQQKIDQAKHLEWIACRAEEGNILWGGGMNRCGWQEREEISE